MVNGTHKPLFKWSAGGGAKKKGLVEMQYLHLGRKLHLG